MTDNERLLLLLEQLGYPPLALALAFGRHFLLTGGEESNNVPGASLTPFQSATITKVLWYTIN
jgi:hypothetical protein